MQGELITSTYPNATLSLVVVCVQSRRLLVLTYSEATFLLVLVARSSDFSLLFGWAA